MELTDNLKKVLQQAASSVALGGAEEEGGFILKKDEGYSFVKVKNDITGTELARALYVANKEEFGLAVVSLLLDGWTLWGSFHSHPGKSVMPSSIDLTKLFKGHPNNFIYSPLTGKMNWYMYKPEEEHDWVFTEVDYNE